MAAHSLTFIIVASVFSFFLLLLLADLLYVVWWRRRFHAETAASAAGSDDPYRSPSKELLYFLCWKSYSRVEPASSTPAAATGSASPAPSPSGHADLMKLQEVHGPSRFLFTIKEEREESEAEEARQAEAEKKTLVVEDTPFATPCASPPFYTPRSSPPRGGEDVVGNLTHASANGYIRVVVD